MSYFNDRMAEIRREASAARPPRRQEIIAERAGAKALREKERAQEFGYVYFFRAGNRVKIGFSTDPRERQTNLQVACPIPAHICKLVAGDRTTEAAFHKRFARYRIQGEWFTLKGDLDLFLCRDTKQIDLPAKKLARERVIDL